MWPIIHGCEKRIIAIVDKYKELPNDKLLLRALKQLARENLLPPSFVEFDDLNDTLLVQNAMNSVKLFTLKDYKEYFTARGSMKPSFFSKN